MSGAWHVHSESRVSRWFSCAALVKNEGLADLWVSFLILCWVQRGQMEWLANCQGLLSAHSTPHLHSSFDSAEASPPEGLSRPQTPPSLLDASWSSSSTSAMPPLAGMRCVFFLKKFYWSVVGLQCCVNFFCTARWLSDTYTYYMYTHIYTYSYSFPTIGPCCLPSYVYINLWSSRCGATETDSTRNHEVAGSIPGFA